MVSTEILMMPVYIELKTIDNDDKSCWKKFLNECYDNKNVTFKDNLETINAHLALGTKSQPVVIFRSARDLFYFKLKYS